VNQRGGGVDVSPKGGSLLWRIVEKSRAGFAKRDEQMAGGIGEGVEEDEADGRADDDVVEMVAFWGEPIVGKERARGGRAAAGVLLLAKFFEIGEAPGGVDGGRAEVFGLARRAREGRVREAVLGRRGSGLIGREQGGAVHGGKVLPQCAGEVVDG
jgi:hypothetical protein